MSFMRNINDLKRILILMFLTLPSIAANVNCNGKPFHCVNSTHFMICVDLGSGVSSTIDDFVIQCPSTTVCQGTNKFECEFPAVTTTTAPLVIPIISASESIETVTTPLYDVTISIPFEEYFNTLGATTLSEDLMTHQTSVTEPTIQVVADYTQHIEVITGPESNSTVSDNITVVNVVQNVLPTHLPLPDSVSTNATDLISNATEYSSTIMYASEFNSTSTIQSVTVEQNYLTTVTPLFNNISSNATDLTVVTENIYVIKTGSASNSTGIDLELSFTDNVTDLILNAIENVNNNFTEPDENATLTLQKATGIGTNTTSLFPDATENMIVVISEPNTIATVSDTIERTTDVSAADNVNIIYIEPEENATVTNAIDRTTYLSANVSDATDNVNVIVSKLKANTTLNENIQRVTDTSDNATDFIKNSTENVNVIIFESEINATVSDIVLKTTNVSPISTDASNNVNVIVLDLEANNTFSFSIQRAHDTSANATGLIPDKKYTTKNVNESETNATLSNTIQRATDIGAYTTDRAPDAAENVNVAVPDPEARNTLSDTIKQASDINLNVTDNNTESLNGIISESKTHVFLNLSVQIDTDIVQNDLSGIDNMVSISTASNLADTVTESILTEITESISSVVLDHDTTFNTTLPDKIQDNIIIKPTVVNEVTGIINVNKSEFNTTVDGNSLNADKKFKHNDFTIISTLNSTALLSKEEKIATEPAIIDMPNIYTKPESNSTDNLATHKLSSDSSSPSNVYTETKIADVPVATDFIANNHTTLEVFNTELPSSIITVPITIDMTANSNPTTESKNKNLTETDTLQYYVLESVTTDNNVLINKLVNGLNKTKTNSYNATNEPTASTDTTYKNQAFSTILTTTDNNNIFNFGETTTNSIIKTTVSEQKINASTYSNLYSYTDTENIAINQETSTNQTNDKSRRSEKVLSTDTIENTASTPTFIEMNNVINTSSEILNIDTSVRNPPEVVSGLKTIMKTEPILSVNKGTILEQELEWRGTSKSSQTVNETSNNLPLNATVLKLVPTFENHIIEHLRLTTETAHNIEIPIDSTTLPNMEITDKLPVVTINLNDVITTEQTLATTFTITETSQAFYSQVSNVGPASKIPMTESEISLVTLTSKIDINDLTLQDPLKEAAIISKVRANSSITPTQISETLHINVESNNTAGSKIINQGIPTAVTATEKESTNIVIEKPENVDYNFDKITSNTTNEESMLYTANTNVLHTEISVPGLYSTLEVIATEVTNKSYVEPPMEVKSVNDTADNIPTLTTLTSLLVVNDPSDILPIIDINQDVTTNAPYIGDQGLEKKTLNTSQHESLNSFAPGLSTQPTFLTEPLVISSNQIKEATETPEPLIESLGNTLGKFITTAENSETSVTSSVTEPYSAMNQIVFTATNGDVSVLMKNTFKGVETTTENNPLVNIPVNSQTEQIPYIEPTVLTENILLESTPREEQTTKIIYNASETLRPVIDNMLYVGSTLPEPYIESTINVTDANLQTKPLYEILLDRAGQGANISTPPERVTNKVLIQDPFDINKHTNMLDVETSQNTQAVNIIPDKSSVDNIEKLLFYKQNLTRDNQPTITSQQQEQAFNYNRASTLEPKPIIQLFPTSTSSINNLNTTKAHDSLLLNIIKKTQLSPNQSVTGRIGNETKNTDMFGSQVTNTQTKIPYIGDTVVAIKSSDILTMEPTNRPLSDKVVTAPYVQTTNQIIIELPIVEVTTLKTFTTSKSPEGSDNTVMSLTVDNVSNLGSQYTSAPQNFKILNEKPVVEDKTINGPTTEPWSGIPQTSEISVQTTNEPGLINIASTSLAESVTIKNKKNKYPTTEQVLTTNSLDSNYDARMFIVDVVRVKSNDPVLIENKPPINTHSGISVTQLPEVANVDQSKKSKESENDENLVGKRSNEKEVMSDVPDTNVPNIVTQVLDTAVPAVAILKHSKPDLGLVNEQNVDAVQKGTQETVGYGLPITTDKIILETAFVTTTINVEKATDDHYKSYNTNFELISSTTAKPTEYFPSNEPKENYNEHVAHIARNSLNINNSTILSTPLTKSPDAKTHNVTFESATNSRNHVCKPNNRGRFSDSKDCRKFYICIGKHEPIQGFCPINTVFSELRKQCTKNLSHCVRNNQFQCVSEGRFSDYLTDNIYYICVKNNVGAFIRFTLQCQSGNHLNKTSVHCDLNTESSQSTSQQSTSDITQASEASTRSEDEKLVESNEKFECKKEGLFPDATDCRKYYICEKKEKSLYRLRIKMCDSDDFFDKDKKKCVDADSYECS